MAMLHATTNINPPALGSGERKKWSFISLFFSLFYFVPLFMTAASSTMVISSIAIYLVFVGFYIWSILSSGKVVFVAITGLLIACVMGTLLHSGGLFLFGFVTFLVAYYARGWGRISLLLIVLACMLASVSYNNVINWPYLIPPALSCLALFAFGLLQRKEVFSQLDKEHAATEFAQMSAIAERERIGRDLHDLVGHSLSSIALKAELAEKLLAHNRTDEAKLQLAELSAVSREVLSDIRKAVTGIKKRSLENELHVLAKALEHANIAVSLNISELSTATLPVNTELQLTFVAKEAVTNILRHSHASKAYIKVYTEQNSIGLCIGDNGFKHSSDDTKLTPAKAHYIAGNGINGMQERLKLINGKLIIKQHEGMHIEATAPLVDTKSEDLSE